MTMTMTKYGSLSKKLYTLPWKSGEWTALWLMNGHSVPSHLLHCTGRPVIMPDWIGLCSVLRSHQHSIGYTRDGFYRSKDPTNSIKVLKEMLQRKKQRTKTTKSHIWIYNHRYKKGYTQNKHNKSLSLHKYGVTRGQLPQSAGSLGLTAVGLPLQYPHDNTQSRIRHRT